MPTAYLTLRPSAHYRIDAFEAGFKRLGYEVKRRAPYKEDFKPGMALLIWNRTTLNNAMALQAELVGGSVFVAENGYIGADRDGWQFYALALNHHNGAGEWRPEGSDRLAGIGVEIKPWRLCGTEIVVLPQRGIGEANIAMPKTWTVEIVKRLKALTDRPIRIRPHPGITKTVAVERDIENAFAVVTWGSGAAIKAIACGVPTFYCFDRWIGGGAAAWFTDGGLERQAPDRLPMFERLAWAQWSLAEIATGEPMRRLLA